MKKSINRFLSVLLAAALLCSLFAFVPVSAAEGETVEPLLTVKADSNYFTGSQASYYDFDSVVDENGDVFVTVEYKVFAAQKLLVNIDIAELTYDSSVLEWKPEYNMYGTGHDAKIDFFPFAAENDLAPGVVHKTGEGRIVANFSTINRAYLYPESGSEAVTVVKAVFKVLHPEAVNGTTTVKCDVEYLAVCDETATNPYVQYQVINKGNVNEGLNLGETTSSLISPKVTLFAGQNLSLGGDIAVQFYLNLTADQLTKGVTVDFAWCDKTDSVEVTQDNFKNGRGYEAVCHVAPAEMAYDITAKVTVGNKQMREEKHYSPCDYADTFFSDAYHDRFIQGGAQEYTYQAFKTLIKAMLDYGSCAQKAFDRLDVPLANKGHDYLTNEVTAETVGFHQEEINRNALAEYGLQYRTTTNVYLTTTTIRHYFTVTDWAKLNAAEGKFLFAGKPVTYSVNYNKENDIYFDLTGIASGKLYNSYTFSVDNQYTLKSSVYDYIYRCLISTKVSPATTDLVKAAYRYGEAAIKCFGR